MNASSPSRRGPGSGGSLTRLSSPHGEPKHLWVLALDGGGLRKLTTEPEDDPSPAWSPDGSRVAYLSGRGLFVIGADGRELTRVVARSGTGPIVWAPR